ncbi:MAG TPA: FG-GAP-like repeat-containing protein [Terriglobales bacterium]|nr:FG-GAP-like repeat-containing protein [Terriglobales bacterium]
MKPKALFLLLVLTSQLLTVTAGARQASPRRDLALAKATSATRTTKAAAPRSVRRNVSQSQVAGLSRGISFLVAPRIDVGGSPRFMVSGDFNGDGFKDIAALTYDSMTSNQYIAVLLGRGDTTFNSSVVTETAFDKKTLLYSGDVNHDGKDDVIVLRSGAFDVFLSTAGGSFQAPVTYQDDILDPAAVTLADINADGKLDLLMADGISGIVDRFLGNNDGTFQAAAALRIPVEFPFAVFADVNKDGNIDVVTGTQVILGSANGSFSMSIPLSTETHGNCTLPQASVAVGDLNADGNPDIVVSDCMDHVSVFLGDGSGAFVKQAPIWSGFHPQTVHIADMNADGIPDIAVGDFYPGGISVLIGDGHGNFQAANSGWAFGGTMLEPFVIDDFNGDGHLDVVAASWTYQAQLSFLKGKADATFVAAKDYSLPQETRNLDSWGTSVATADFNKDGLADLVLGGIFIASDGNTVQKSGVSVFLGTPGAISQPGMNYGSGGQLANVAVGDFDRDGNMDIVAADAATGVVNLFLGNGDGSFKDPQFFPSAPDGANAIIVADFNHDGAPDVAVAGYPNALYLLLNDKTGQFQAPIVYALNDDAWALAAGDINGDGKLDIVLPHFAANTFSVLLGNGDGSFRALPDFTNGSVDLGGVALRDLNGDGKLDLAFTIAQGAAVAFGNGDGTFQSPSVYDASHGSQLSEGGNLVIADFNGDGKLDIAFTNTGLQTLDVLLGNGDGSFASATEFPLGAMPFDVTTADLNGDGSQDIAATSLLYPGVITLLNSGGTAISVTTTPNPASYGQPVVLGASIVATVSGGNTLNGTVTFFDNGAALGSASPDANGNAWLAVSTLAVGSHTITAMYSGDSHLSPATSAAVLEQVQGDTPSYSLTADQTTTELQPGQSAIFNITATSLNGFSGVVNFSCGQVPEYISCNFGPASAVLAPGQQATTQLTVTVGPGALAYAATPAHRSFAPLWAMFTFGLVGCVLLDNGKLRKSARSLRGTALALVLLALTGCGAGSPQGLSQHARTATIQVRATAARSSRQLNLAIVVHQ